MKLPRFMRRARKVFRQQLHKFRVRSLLVEQGPIRIVAQLEDGPRAHIIGLAWLKSLHENGAPPIDIRGDVALMSFLTSGDGSFVNGLHRADQPTPLKGDAQLVFTELVSIPYISMARIAGHSPELAGLFSRVMLFAQKHHKYIAISPRYNGAWAKMCSKIMDWDQWSAHGANGAFPFSADNVRTLAPSVPAGPVRFEGAEPYNGRYITIHADDSPGWAAPKTGQWPLERWADFCRLFKAEHPGIAIVQVGFGAGEGVSGVDWNIAGQKSLADLAAVLKSSALHIDGDSGLVHLRALLGGQSVVLFGPTVAGYRGYPENINIVSSRCGECMNMQTNWESVCVKGRPSAECMAAISPEELLDVIRF